MDADSTFYRLPKYKSYHEDVSQVLISFERAKDWADIIKCLQRLNKVLQNYPDIPVLPAKITFAKRLTQCLNPGLPSGVHLKALETYQQIFSRIQAPRLAKDLSLFSAGLFPLFQNATTQVKPVLLDIFEKYYLPLGSELYPCLTGFITALLPGLEEQSEFHQKVLNLLDGLCRHTDKTIFFRSVWKSVLLRPSARLHALNYLILRLPSNKSNYNEMKQFLPERSTLVLRALTVSLTDESLLVRRAVLDLLVSHFKLQERVFQIAN
eukprot:TRINITY_DN3132_c0_g1_i3.p1 TRINITY_DN3132_c0_g1~~TRINITY_DN3132_c0_g1_i3.p1  ORF type:complete len:266 (-),score=37.72 TRINITY_DN3132_c0_g1_i3:78-875(-)